MVARDSLLLRGMRWRVGTSVLTVLVTTIAVATAVLGPLYLSTASDSVLRRTVASAAVQDRGVTVGTYSDQLHSLGAVRRAERIVQSPSNAGRLYGTAITTVESGVVLSAGKSQLFSRTGICRVVRLRQGRCDLGFGDVVMTERAARASGVSVGGTIEASAAGRRTPLRLRITGIISTPDLGLPYWWGDGEADFPFGQSAGEPTGVAETDPLIASQATALAVPAQDVPTASGQIPLRTDAVGLGNEGAVKQALTRTVATLSRQGIQAGSQLPELLAQADHQRREMTTIVAIAAIQLVLLAIWVLGSLLVRSSDGRRAEARVARLRGFPVVSMVWVTAAEPGLLCLCGAVLGVAAAWVAIVVARTQLFLPSAVIVFDGWTFTALGLTLAAITAALGIGTARLLRADDPGDGGSRTSRGSSVMARIADAVLMVLAIVALVALGATGGLNGGAGDPVATAAPGLIALGAAVLAVQLILFACRLGISLTADSGRVGIFLALRQSVRRPGVLRQARVLIIALCLACFAAAAWSVARTNRATAAQFQVGAPTVLTVAPQSATSLERAVTRADPSGRFAMAVIDLHTPSARLLAVDAQRLAAVASWPRRISARGLQSVMGTLDPASVPAVQLPDGPVRVEARMTAPASQAPVALGLWVFNGTGGTAVIDLGQVHEGEGSYASDLAGLCPGGCQLAGLGLLPASGRRLPTAGTYQLSIGHVWSVSPGAGLRTVSADLVPGGWGAAAPGVRVQSRQAPGLTLTATAAAIDADAGATGPVTPPMVSPADHPHLLPAVVTSDLASLNVQAVASLPTEGLDGNPINVRPSVIASALPRIGTDALMIDLGLLSRVQVGPTSANTTDEVWLGRRAPGDVLSRLRAAGLTPTGVQRSSSVFAQMQRSGPALADDFLLLATLAALLVAAMSTLGALGATTRERAAEMVSLEVAGVPRPVLVRSLGVESVILILTALCGAAAGALAAVMAIPSLPELGAASFAPLQYGLPAGLFAGVVLVVVAAVSLAAAAVTVVVVRRMSPALLRMVPDDVSA